MCFPIAAQTDRQQRARQRAQPQRVLWTRTLSTPLPRLAQQADSQKNKSNFRLGAPFGNWQSRPGVYPLNWKRIRSEHRNDLSRLSDAELIQQLSDTAKELGIEINLNYSFLQRNKPDDEPQG
jgi:hypothetical protein